MEKGMLDTVGSEIVGIVTPVSICMFLVVLLVQVVNLLVWFVIRANPTKVVEHSVRLNTWIGFHL